MKPNNIWSVTWSRSTPSEIDIEINAIIELQVMSDIEADSATKAIRKFMYLFPDVNWNKQMLRAEKNKTYFVFTVEDNILRRLDPTERI